MDDKKNTIKLSKPTPILRAQFREIARDIIAIDRRARKLGISQNTIGSIERAMVHAYTLGQKDFQKNEGQNPESVKSNLDWLEIPPRSRQVIISMTSNFSKNYTFNEVSYIDSFVENGKRRWKIIYKNYNSNKSHAESSVAPLIRLGLLEAHPDQEDRYVLTSAGIASGKEYWRRANANDPTLPREGFR